MSVFDCRPYSNRITIPRNDPTRFPDLRRSFSRVRREHFPRATAGLKAGIHTGAAVAFCDRRRQWAVRTMSLRFRLIALVWVVLPISLAFGGLAAWVNASRSVRVEMFAARQAARQTIETAVERLPTAPDPARYRDELVASFSGNRHLRVWLVWATAPSTAPAGGRPPPGGGA